MPPGPSHRPGARPRRRALAPPRPPRLTRGGRVEPPSPRSLELRALALRLVPALARDGAAVALTGSAARGDAGPGSDLDLWVVGARSGRRSLVVDGVPVTLLQQTPDEALAFDSLCLYETRQLLVLHDAPGHFARVGRAAHRQRRAVRAAILEATAEDVARLEGLAAGASPLQRVVLLREVALRLAGLWLFHRTGWRMSRLRQFQAWLPRPALGHLEAVLGLDVPAATVRRVLRRWPDAPREVHTALHTGQVGDALLRLRRCFVDDLIPEALGAARDLAALRGTKLHDDLLALHGATERREGRRRAEPRRRRRGRGR